MATVIYVSPHGCDANSGSDPANCREIGTRYAEKMPYEPYRKERDQTENS